MMIRLLLRLTCVVCCWVIVCTAQAQSGDTFCTTLAPVANGVCEVSPAGSGLLLQGDVLAPGQIYRGGSVRVTAEGLIDCVGCECAANGATTLRCPRAAISPGLINAHDHITSANNFPRVDSGERYEHRHDFRHGLNGHTRLVTSGSASTLDQRRHELRQLMSGTTSIVGVGGVAGLVRNLDRPALTGGLSQANVVAETFPLGDSGGSSPAPGSCAYPDITTRDEIVGEDAFLAHAGEGVDARALQELMCLSSSAGQDLTQDNSAFVNVVGAQASDYLGLATDGTELVWSPRSNISLYGETARVSEAARLGMTIALGTDWIVSGSMNLLRELACASHFNAQYLDHFFSDAALFDMVTRNAAKATGLSGVIGSLVVGSQADIAVFDARTHTDYRSLIDAAPADVLLVLRGGKALYGDSANVAGIPTSSGCEEIDVCGVAKRVCLSSEIGLSYAQLNSNGYPIFSCSQPPPSEPTCTPSRGVSLAGSGTYDGVSRTNDLDGDGVLGALDNCPSVFNPIRVLDVGAQADADGDGRGDACDALPLGVEAPVPVPALGGGGGGGGAWPTALALAALVTRAKRKSPRSPTS